MGEKLPWAVALTKCFFCGGDGNIIIPRTLTQKVANSVEEMHGKVVDMNPCNKCKELMKQGVILITFDPAKSEKDWNKHGPVPNPYRTGGFFVVKDEAVRRIFNDEGGATAFALKYRWIFIEHAVAVQLGLFEHRTEEVKQEAV